MNLLRKGMAAILVCCLMVATSVYTHPLAASADLAVDAATPVACTDVGPSTGMLTAGEMASFVGGDPVDGICYVAGVCTGFWPYGTLICGPTATGCAVMYFVR